MKKLRWASRWKEWQIYLGHLLLCLFFAVIGAYGVISSFQAFKMQRRSFQVEKLIKYRRSPERRIVMGTLYGLIGTTGASIYTWLLIKEVRKNQNSGKGKQGRAFKS